MPPSREKQITLRGTKVEQDVLKQRLTTVFRNTFFQPALEINEAMTASDVDGWDSFSHFNLGLAAEKDFGISVTPRDVRSMKNVGNLIRLIDKKLSQPV